MSNKLLEIAVGVFVLAIFIAIAASLSKTTNKQTVETDNGDIEIDLTVDCEVSKSLIIDSVYHSHYSNNGGTGSESHTHKIYDCSRVIKLGE